jgi:hypothetical protein
MATTDDRHLPDHRPSVRWFIGILVSYGSMLGLGAVGLIAALDARQPCGWLVAGLALVGGVHLADRLARSTDSTPSSPRRHERSAHSR